MNSFVKYAYNLYHWLDTVTHFLYRADSLSSVTATVGVLIDAFPFSPPGDQQAALFGQGECDSILSNALCCNIHILPQLFIVGMLYLR